MKRVQMSFFLSFLVTCLGLVLSCLDRLRYDFSGVGFCIFNCYPGVSPSKAIDIICFTYLSMIINIEISHALYKRYTWTLCQSLNVPYYCVDQIWFILAS